MTTDSNYREIARLQGERDELHRQLCNLLARIHRDGGHYADRHGLTKAVADADLVVAELHCLADEVKRTTNQVLRREIPE